MNFSQTPLPGVWVIELQLQRDERGWFARTFDADEFQARGMDLVVAQTNASYNARAGTLRGLHYQVHPHGEPKLVRCARGAIFDVAVDLRPGASTYRRWHAVELSIKNSLMLFIPTGVAHGFQTLVDDCEVLYQMGHKYVAGAARGIRWDDPAFAIEWPPAPKGGRLISDRDRAHPNFRS